VAAPGSAGTPRVGLVVGRRVGNAVDRNRAKRRLRHALIEISLEQGMDYVIIADREVLDTPFESLVERLSSAVAACA
jgi:ribonuclease P protein component